MVESNWLLEQKVPRWCFWVSWFWTVVGEVNTHKACKELSGSFTWGVIITIVLSASMNRKQSLNFCFKDLAYHLSCLVHLNHLHQPTETSQHTFCTFDSSRCFLNVLFWNCHCDVALGGVVDPPGWGSMKCQALWMVWWWSMWLWDCTMYKEYQLLVEILSLLVWRLSYVLLGFMYLNECRIVSQSIMNTHLWHVVGQGWLWMLSFSSQPNDLPKRTCWDGE